MDGKLNTNELSDEELKDVVGGSKERTKDNPEKEKGKDKNKGESIERLHRGRTSGDKDYPTPSNPSPGGSRPGRP